MENNELIDTLNTLIETSRDGDNGFTACAEDGSLEPPGLGDWSGGA